MHDITKLVDDISLDALLDGHYEPPSLGKEKVKKPAHVNGTILHTVRKAFTVLQRQVPSRVKQYDEMDFASNHRILPLSSIANIRVPSSVANEEENSLTSDSSTCTKELGDKTEETKEPPQRQLYEPKVLLEQLALSPTEDLDLLLQDAEVLSSSCNDPPPHSLKVAASEQASLPSFSWSHNHYNGYLNSSNSNFNPDSTKVSKKSSCHGSKWVRIGGKKACFHGGSSERYSVCLESLTFDQSLVPCGSSVKYVLPGTGNGSSSKPVGPTKSEKAPSSAIAAADESSSAAPCPRSFLAAQTLLNIATKITKDPTTADDSMMMKSPKLPSRKSMKARKSHSIATPEGPCSSSAKSPPTYPISKKVKQEIVDGERSSVVPCGYLSAAAAPKLSRSSPIRSETDHRHPHPSLETNHKKGLLMSSNYLFKQQQQQEQLISGPLPPTPGPPRLFDSKNSSSSSSRHRQQKARKVVGQIDWNFRGRS